MSSTLFTALLAVAVAAPAPKGEKLTPPSGPPPIPCVVTKVDEEKGELQIQVAKTAPVTEYRTIVKQIQQGGQVINVTEMVPVTVTKTHFVEFRITIKGMDALDGEGKKIAEDQVIKRLKVGDVILRGEGEPVDPAWLRIYKPDVILLQSKTPAKGPAPAPAPAPKK